MIIFLRYVDYIAKSGKQIDRFVFQAIGVSQIVLIAIIRRCLRYKGVADMSATSMFSIQSYFTCPVNDYRR